MASGSPEASKTSGRKPPVVRVPRGVRVSYAVFERGRVVAERRSRQTFRSASVVKILIALDYLERHRASAADRALLQVMLRSSDDKAATEFWRRGGQRQVVERMVRRAGLAETAPPPADKPGFWGYTAISARDVVKTYRYLLEKAPKGQREFVLEQLRRSTPCGTDGFDQTFGIPSAAKRPWAVKQGWSGFGDVPAEPCRKGGARPAAWQPDLGLGRPVLHTTGVVGDGKIVVVLTLQPAGTSFRTASARVTDLARQLVRV
ncbi:hypothetical protein [Actinomadura decatromicini]|uniref:hypothetical protein n=1 Tax=Actinomadura decatromicini TaxID=2604572 RepID=UPI001FE45C55|nr:hypothetical protein [Actinomadura decatromicini]